MSVESQGARPCGVFCRLHHNLKYLHTKPDIDTIVIEVVNPHFRFIVLLWVCVCVKCVKKHKGSKVVKFEYRMPAYTVFANN